MLRRATYIAAKETRFYLREWEVYFWSFAMPVAFMYFLGSVTSQSGGPGSPAKEALAVAVPANAGFLAVELIDRLAENGYLVKRIDGVEDAASKDDRRLIVPDGFTERVLRGEKTILTVERRSEGIAAAQDDFRVARAVYTLLAELAACARSGQPADAEAIERLHNAPRSLTVDVRPAGKRKQVPTGFEQAVPGNMIMFTLLALLSSGSVSLVVERRQGLLKRLASAPIRRGEVFVGKWIGRLALGMLQIVFCMVVGTVLFGMNWGPDLPMILVVLLTFAALCASLGMVLGNVARTEGQGIGVAVLAANGLSALGGLWWPIEITPRWMQALAQCLPTGWAMHAVHQLVSYRAGPLSVGPQLIALALAALLATWLGIRTFRYQ